MALFKNIDWKKIEHKDKKKEEKKLKKSAEKLQKILKKPSS